MPFRRQLLAAGLLLVAVLAAPTRALPATQTAQAQAASTSPTPSAPTTLLTSYLPLFSRGAAHDLSVQRVEVVQGVTLGDSYTFHVAGRPALVRVFVILTGNGASVSGVSARLRRYVGGVQQAQLTAGPLTIPPATNEGNLSHTFNFNLPAGWLTVGSAYVVDLDHDNDLPETNEGNNRYPATGQQSFNFTNMAALNIVIVPVTYKGHTPPTVDLSYLSWMPPKILPVSQINYSVRPTPYTFNGDLTQGSGWIDLLEEIDGVHSAENPAGDKLYFGLVDSVAADGCDGGCIAGIGFISSPGNVWQTSVGFAGFPGSVAGRNEASSTFTHEMGHNFGRRHAPCGNPAGPDGSYPYAGAIIGQWGYDTADGTLKNPGTYRDYMSYCGPEWTSDYTYYGIAQAWGWLNAAASLASAGPTESLLVNGYFGPDGALHLDPVFAAQAPPSGAPAQPTHRLELLDAGGQVLADVPFELTEVVIDSTVGRHEQAESFHVLAPAVPGLAGLRLYHGDELLYERLAASPAPALAAATPAQTRAPNGGLNVSWQLAAGHATHFRVRFSPDGGATWHLLALDTAASDIEVPAVLIAGAKSPLLEVQAGDGVRSVMQTFLLASP